MRQCICLRAWLGDTRLSDEYTIAAAKLKWPSGSAILQQILKETERNRNQPPPQNVVKGIAVSINKYVEYEEFVQVHASTNHV